MNKRKVTAIAVGIATVVGVGLTFFMDKEPEKYSQGWIEGLTPERWEAEREIVRQQFCSSGNNKPLAIRLQNLLRLFDKVKRDREWTGKEYGFPAPREHGWYLPND